MRMRRQEGRHTVSNRGSALDEGETDGLNVQLKTIPWDAQVRSDPPFVVYEAIRIYYEGSVRETWGSICLGQREGKIDMQQVL